MRSATQFILWSLFALASGAGLALSAAFLYLNPQIPAVETFTDVKLRAPLRIYTSDDKLIQEFGERLTPVTYNEIPPLFTRALLDTEDKRFFEHSGIDLITLANATWQLVRNKGEIRTGASTITMQLVKNISGDTEVRFIRKFKEMLLAIKLEQELTKQEILTLYVNIIPFGKHAFGIQAAANTYYGKDIHELSLAQTAMLAGIPQAPEAGNPVNGPERAVARRNLVLFRMREQGSITEEDYVEATEAPITAEVHSRAIDVPSLYVAETVRKRLLSEYGTNAYNEGLVVHTTLHGDLQLSAEMALEAKLNEYDRRHGYRGPEYRRLQGTDQYLAASEYGYPPNWVKTLENLIPYGNQHPAIVAAVRENEIDVLTRDLELITIPWEGLSWARPYIDVNTRGPRPRKAADIVSEGDLVRIEEDPEVGWALGQVPDIQGALVALDPMNGAVRALVGGYDFNAKQYNHATQARRQPGSNFKPFFYAGALESGLTAASVYNDSPIVLPGGELEEVYRPKNSGDVFHGNIRLREALYRSINLVSLRVILDYGAGNAIDYVSRFGFDTSAFPRDVQLAFGGGTIGLTPLEVATGYAAFANGGYKVDPYLISSITSINNDEIFTILPATVCETQEDCGDFPMATRIIEPRVAYIMDSILSDVVVRGTGTKARRALKRSDLRGKTGTTNDADIWFSGYTHDLVATTWAGFDDNSPVGNREWGSTVPIETWIAFMEHALPSEDESRELPLPDGLVSVRIDPDSGYRAEPTDPDAIFEIFREEMVPPPPPALARKEEDEEPVKQIF
jgi:penicillin-binding protein 1A